MGESEQHVAELFLGRGVGGGKVRGGGGCVDFALLVGFLPRRCYFLRYFVFIFGGFFVCLFFACLCAILTGVAFFWSSFCCGCFVSMMLYFFVVVVVVLWRYLHNKVGARELREVGNVGVRRKIRRAFAVVVLLEVAKGTTVSRSLPSTPPPPHTPSLPSLSLSLSFLSPI